MTANLLAPSLGFGLGARPAHYDDLLLRSTDIDWLEALTENYLVPGGKPLHYLHRLSERYPVVLHGVSLSIGGSDALDREYLKQVRTLASDVDARWISDHLCWTGVDGVNLHDLMPVPFTGEALRHIAARIRDVQDFLGRRILIENVSSYLSYRDDEMTEWEFLGELTHEADCLILLDINNVYVSSVNHGFDALEYLRNIPTERVQQFHLAGHSNMGTHLVDTHDAPVADAVWELYTAAVRRFGAASPMIERDANIPDLTELVNELNKARDIAESLAQAA